MLYLNPALWAGLFLAALPIIIHLLGKRRIKKQPFPSLEFLQKLQIKRMRKIRIKQWLLLILRTLAVLLLALAFLRPSLIKSGENRHSRIDAVILLDLSASMSARMAEGIPLIKAKEILPEVIRSFDNRGQIAVVISDGEGARDIQWQEYNNEIPLWIDKLESDARPSNLQTAWMRVHKLLSSSAAPEKELIWISDFNEALNDSLVDLPENTRIIRIPLNGSTYLNAAISLVKYIDPFVQSGQPINLEVHCDCYGGDKELPAILSANIEGKRVAEKEINIIPGKTTVATMIIPPQKSGKYAAEITLDLEDALTLDNRYPFVLNLEDQKRVLIAGDDLSAIRYFELALNSQKGRQKNFKCDKKAGGLKDVKLADYDMIILAGNSTLRKPEINLLDDYVSRGGGLWVLLGDKSNVAELSRDLLDRFGFGSILEESRFKGSLVSWEEINLGHPAFAGILENTQKYDVPRVFRSFKAAEKNGDDILVRLSNGNAFLLERHWDKGKIWFTPSAVDTSWTDWPLTGIFASLVQSGVTYLASENQEFMKDNYCGQVIRWPYINEVPEKVREALDPLGNLVPVVLDYETSQKSWMSKASLWPGHYRLLDRDNEVNIAAVRFPPIESDLGYRGDSKIYPGSILLKKHEESYESALKKMSHGREISWELILFAFILLVIETLVAREKKSINEKHIPEYRGI